MKRTLSSLLAGVAIMISADQALAAPPRDIILDLNANGPTIDRNIFGQFAEQLGEGIYGGVWVGPQSPISNVRGIRTDVVDALKALKVPNVRWPGGCFADSYHWRDGIGPASKRPVTYNINWGTPTESNQFGTDEFMDFVEQIGSEAYVSANVGSGTVREAAEWMEYMTSAEPTLLTKERATNGHEKPYRVKFLGLGNEVWACGGQMTVETYLGHVRTFSHYARNLNPAMSGSNRFMPAPDPMLRIAVGPGDDNPEYTEAIMKEWARDPAVGKAIEGLSIHHYTMGPKGLMRDPATGFGELEYATFIKNSYHIEKMIADNAAIMDRYDPKKKVALVVDEWGAWLQPMAGTPVFNIKQQNSLRDALVAAIHLNIFARHADRVRMANIAQMVNVLQSMILTDGNRMLLTPTYHVFKMYVPFQDATLVPLKLEPGEYRTGDVATPQLDAIAAKSKDGTTWISLVNVDPAKPLSIRLPGVGKLMSGQTLTAERVDTINSYDQPNAVTPRAFSGRAAPDGVLVTLPAKSVTVLQVQ